MNIDKIIVGVDFSEQSEVAIEQALDIARMFAAEVVLVHASRVSRPADEISDGMDMLLGSFEQIVRQELADQRARLAKLPARFSTHGVTISHMAIEAEPARGLADVAHELDADLLVVGTHGRGGVRHFLLGSVAERAVRYARTTTMVARPQTRDDGYRKVLVPVDLTGLSDTVVDTAVALAAPHARIELFHVWDVWDLPNLTQKLEVASAHTWRGQMREAARGLAHQLIARHRDRSDLRLTFAQAEGSPAQRIHERLDAHGYDLVVVGSHGRRGVRRLLLGSVAETTVRYAPCSTVVVHEPPPPPPPLL